MDHRRSLFEWGRDAAYSDLPGFLQAIAVEELPKDVQFTNEAALDLFGARANNFFNKVLIWLNFLYDILIGRGGNRFDEYRKVLLDLTILA